MSMYPLPIDVLITLFTAAIALPTDIRTRFFTAAKIPLPTDTLTYRHNGQLVYVPVAPSYNLNFTTPKICRRPLTRSHSSPHMPHRVEPYDHSYRRPSPPPIPPPMATQSHSPSLSVSSLDSSSVSSPAPRRSPTDRTVDSHSDSPSLSYPPGQNHYIIAYTDDAATKLNDRVRRRCFNCCTTDTSTWRRSNLSPGKVLCNKCGLFERTHGRSRPDQFPHRRGPLATPMTHVAPDIITYRYNDQLVYVPGASSYDGALARARDAFPQLKDLRDTSLSLSLSAPTSGYAPISASAWPTVVAHMSRYQIVDVHVSAHTEYRFVSTIASLSRSSTIPLHVSSRPLSPCPVSLASPPTSRPSHTFPSRQPLPPSSLPSLSDPSVPKGATTSPFQLPAPVTTNDNIARLNGRINVERSAVPPLVALSAGLAAVSSSQPRAVLLFIGAGTVILGIYFVVPPKDGEKIHPVMSAFLQRLPDIFTAAGCALIVLGIGAAFPDEVALIPLFLFISIAALALLFGAILAVWVTVAFYGVALCSLVTFVVFAFMA